MRRSVWNSDYIAVDWGTTNRRAYRISGGGVADSFEDDRGVLALEKTDFDQAVADIRVRLGDRPMLLAGMVGSNKGWHEVPYVGVPAGIDELAEGILWLNDTTGIIPGVCQRSEPDVMRGEETQVLGALAIASAPSESLFCLPGTHSKWVALSNQSIARFQSAMTGEVFGLLKDHSILADQLQSDAKVGPDFEAGVASALGGTSLLSAIFAVRARHLLNRGGTDDASHVSGLLIGNDVAAALANHDAAHIVFIGRPDLCALYGAAAAQAGKEFSVVDGAAAFVAGVNLLVEGL